MANYEGRFVWGPIASIPMSDAAELTFALDSATRSVAQLFRAPKDGIINKVGVYVSAITGDPPPYNVGLEGVSDGSGDGGYPSGVAFGGSALKSYDFTATGWIWVTLDTPAAVSAGDLVAARVKPGGVAPDGDNKVTVVYIYGRPLQMRRAMIYSVASWTAYSGHNMGAMYDDGTIAMPAITGVSYTFNTGSTPDEVGCLLQLPFAAQCVGALAYIYAAGYGRDFTLKLYDAAGAVLTSLAFDISKEWSIGRSLWLAAWDPVSLSALTDYRLTVLPTTEFDITLAVVTVNEVASREAFMEGIRWWQTSRVDAGDWTEDTLKLPMLALLLSRITVGDGGGGGVEPMAGLIVG